MTMAATPSPADMPRAGLKALGPVGDTTAQPLAPLDTDADLKPDDTPAVPPGATAGERFTRILHAAGWDGPDLEGQSHVEVHLDNTRARYQPYEPPRSTSGSFTDRHFDPLLLTPAPKRRPWWHYSIAVVLLIAAFEAALYLVIKH